VELDGQMMARQGAMVAYQGNVQLSTGEAFAERRPAQPSGLPAQTVQRYVPSPTSTSTTSVLSRWFSSA
jgi:hypothetical protein